jgi:hypothetical protein
MQNFKLIPDGLADLFADTVLATMTGVVDIRHPDVAGGYDQVSGHTGFAEQVPFYGADTGDGPGAPARVQAHGTGPAGETPSGRDKATGGYLVAVPHTVVEARIGDVVRVYDGGDDLAMTGPAPGVPALVLVVAEIPKATIILQRNLRCELHEQAQKGSA